MSGAIPPLPNTPPWSGAQLKHRDNFTFTFHGAESLRRKQSRSFSGNFSPLMEPGSSLSCSQEPANDHYPEPDESGRRPYSFF